MRVEQPSFSGRAAICAPALARLAEALTEGAHLWRPRPFVAPPPWRESHPELAAWCDRLTPDEVIAIEVAAGLPGNAPAVLRSWEERLASLTALPLWTASASAPAPRSVPARKVSQIRGFAAALGHLIAMPRSVLDWCGGKGHLGRHLGARWGVPVRVLERDGRYAEDAERLAHRDGVALAFIRGDALAPPAGLFTEGGLAVGLHACGELGTRLLVGGVAASATALALAPCCLHKVSGLGGRGYEPVSRAGRACDPGLDHGSLRLASADEVVARPSLRRTRQRDNAWRLALDRLLREAGADGYTALGPLPELGRAPDLETFAITVAESRGLALPARWDGAALEAYGVRRAAEVRAEGLVRALFRRAIEVWCALDRAAFLVEAGMEVAVGRFADRAVTPRDILIVAASCRR